MAETNEKTPTNLRALTIMEVMAREGRPLTPTDLIELTGLPKATVHRLCATLTDEGFLVRDLEGGRLHPSRRSRRIASGLLATSRLHIGRRQVLEDIAATIGETINLAAPSDGGMVYLDRVDTPWPLRFQLPIGSEVPFHCTASGKLFLSSLAPRQLNSLLTASRLTKEGPNTIVKRDALIDELNRVREAGFSWDNEEFMIGMIAFAAQISDPEGRFVAAIAFHAPIQRLSFSDGRRHVETLLSGAKRMEKLLFDAP